MTPEQKAQIEKEAELAALREELEKVKAEKQAILNGIAKGDELANQQLESELAAARKEIEELKNQNQWIPLPDSFTEVLTFNGRVESGWHDLDGCWFSEHRDGEIIAGVTHWRPLPPSPELK